MPVYKPGKYDGKWSSSGEKEWLTKWFDIPWKVREKRADERDSDYSADIVAIKSKKNKDFSISFWIFTNATVQTEQWQTVFSVSQSTQPGFEWDRCPAIFLWCCHYKAFHIRSRGPSNWNAGIGMDGLELEKWNVPVATPLHVTAVFTGLVTNIYYNGDHRGIIELDETPVDILPDGHVMVGYNHKDTPNSYVMRDVAIYNETLSTTQIKCIYNETAASINRMDAEKALGITNASSSYEGFTSLKENFITDVSLPNLTENFNSYRIITDVNESNSDSLAVDMPTSQSNSASGSSTNGQYTTTLSARDYGFRTDKNLTYFQFDTDKKQYINIPNPLNWTQEGLTFSMWYRVSQKGEIWPRLFDFGNGPADNNVLVSCLQGGLQFYVFGYGSIVHHKNWELNHMHHNTWNHLTWTLSVTNPAKDPKDPSFGQWKIYVNGLLKTTIDNMLYPYSIDRRNQYIGKSNWTADDYLDGSIGDFRIYNKVLNESQVKEVFSLQ
jgi:hypothetical protein